MGVLSIILGIFFPRLVLVCLWLFTTVPDRAFEGVLFPLLGFFFLPYTTLAYAFAMVTNGSVSGFYLALVIIAAVFDLRSTSAPAKKLRSRRDARCATC
ncbi:MAG: hypothetical protein K2Y21_06640 [Phycisphaerales bacterium]|nr:hypothetical protein [Phycisphaerales bacterium]